MRRIFAAIVLAAITLLPASAQTIDSLLTAKTKTPFNGVVPVFGTLDYGYGITMGSIGNIGTTGIVPGFISMNFYFPKDKMSIIVLQNIAWPEMFYYHQQVLKIIKENK